MKEQKNLVVSEFDFLADTYWITLIDPTTFEVSKVFNDNEHNGNEAHDRDMNSKEVIKKISELSEQYDLKVFY